MPLGELKAIVCAVAALIENAPASEAHIRARSLDYQINFDVEARAAEAILVTFKTSAVTQVGGGENNGLELAERHVVTDVRSLGPVAGTSRFTAPVPETGYGCALLVQEKNAGRILGGAYCQ
ncbi:MAG: DUF1223 domain-containing protein [Pseudomonadota bacterium]